VIEPGGEKCYYEHKTTAAGGELSSDMTQGFGPERYRIKAAKPGTYRVIVHYYSPNANLLAGETHVNVVVTRHADSLRETIERHSVVLSERNQQVEVTKVGF
jgi:uncharacterized protein YfaP (DUF2135 family)